MNIKIDGKLYPVPEIYHTVFGVPEVYHTVLGTEENGKRSNDFRLDYLLLADAGYGGRQFKNKFIVDCGCNIGYFTLSLASLFPESTVVGVDNYKEHIEVCKTLREKHDIRNASFLLDTLPDTKLRGDVALALSIVHHSQTNFSINKDWIEYLSLYDHIYLELAHHHECLPWASRIKPSSENIHESPILLQLDMLENSFPDYIIRPLGLTRTHYGSTRCMYYCKRKTNIEKEINGVSYTIIDTWNIPYIGFPYTKYNDSTEFHVSNDNYKNYYKAKTKDNKYVFIKEINDSLVVEPFIDGLLLYDVQRLGLTCFYDRKKIIEQIREIVKSHYDPYPWNFIINRNSDISIIDTEEISFYEHRSTMNILFTL